jgi:acetyltransferase-like isoleucine patch superfamily enzyme
MLAETVTTSFALADARKRMKQRIPFVPLILVGLLPNLLKRIYYRARGAKIGRNVSLGLFTYIDSPSIEIGDDTKFGLFTFLRARTAVHIGRRVRINSFVAVDCGEFYLDDDSTVMELTLVGGLLSPRSSVRIGKRVKIFPHSFLDATEPIVIEDDVGVAHYILTHSSWQSILDGFPVEFGPVTLKRGSRLAWGVFVLPNVTVGEYSTIGAGSVVTRDVPPWSLAVGSPAKVIKARAEYIKEFSLEEKNTIILRIMRDYAEFLEYMGWRVDYQPGSQSATIQVNGDPMVYIVYDQRLVGRCPPKTRYIVTLEPLSRTQMQELVRQGVVWFDIGNHVCTMDRHALWQETRSYFSHYGIRFAVQEETRPA